MPSLVVAGQGTPLPDRDQPLDEAAAGGDDIKPAEDR
jgi:hypothetical protein